MLNLLFALLGLLVGGVINLLADDLPRRIRPFSFTCPRCNHPFTLATWLQPCPGCQLPTRKRIGLVFISTIALFAVLPSLISEPINLAVNTLYIAILILVIVIDLEHKLILDVVTYPTTILAILFSSFVVDMENSLAFSIVGAVTGFALFFVIYQLAERSYGAGAIGAGDVKLAMAMGAMLGFHRILFALILAILLGGLISFLLLLTRLARRDSYLPYGQYLALAAIIMLIWGVEFFRWYVN